MAQAGPARHLSTYPSMHKSVGPHSQPPARAYLCVPQAAPQAMTDPLLFALCTSPIKGSGWSPVVLRFTFRLRRGRGRERGREAEVETGKQTEAEIRE